MYCKPLFPYAYLFLNLLCTVVDHGFFPHRYPLISEKKKEEIFTIDDHQFVDDVSLRRHCCLSSAYLNVCTCQRLSNNYRNQAMMPILKLREKNLI